MSKTLNRKTFTTSRLMEFFNEKELQMQIGHSRQYWPIALLKELVDNSLDACENGDITPEIKIELFDDSVCVTDNGPGISEDVIEKSLDYLVRVSDKNHYVSPTRGQLGNALKCVWAAPFVVDGEAGRVEVGTRGKLHQIQVSLDRIGQTPKLDHTVSNGIVKTETFVKMHWPQIASYLNRNHFYDSYNTPPTAHTIITEYTAFNPHVLIRFFDSSSDFYTFAPTALNWRKWKPNRKTSPHWYTPEKLQSLIAATVHNERDNGRQTTVREFITDFDGLTSTAKSKRVTEVAGLGGKYLNDLVINNDIPMGPIRRLLECMKNEAKKVKPLTLGSIGKDHFTHWLTNHAFCDQTTIKYKKVVGEAAELPFVLEIAVGIHTKDYEGCKGGVTVGVNWTPMLTMPIKELQQYLGENRVDSFDPVRVVVHLACPRIEFTDRGKSRLSLPGEIGHALRDAINQTTKVWKKAKRQADKDDRVRQRQLNEMRQAEKVKKITVKEAAYQVMEKAYLHASANGTLPANARQIMYAARPDIIKLTGKAKPWSKSSYFTQVLLPNFVKENEVLTASWDVVYDARGKLLEPHREDRTDTRVDLGTLQVRRYVHNWTGERYGLYNANQRIKIPRRLDTTGPTNRYEYALFIEKEGFNELLEASGIANRYDIAIMSTKGMSVTAARMLIEKLSEQGVTILVARDYDKAGFTIAHTMSHDTRRWQYKTPPNITDLGLFLDDAQEMNLQDEEVTYDSKKNPRVNLIECGASKRDCNFLVTGGYPGNWTGKRIELNAMTSSQFIDWLEKKLDQAGVEKFVPDETTLDQAYDRAFKIVAIEKAIVQAQKSFDRVETSQDRLKERVENKLKKNTGLSWDDAIFEIVKDDEAPQ